MKGKIKKLLLIAGITIILTIPCSMNVQAAAVSNVDTNSVAMTETKSPKLLERLKNLKSQIAGLFNLDLGNLDKVEVSTKDDVKVLLENSNVNVNIDIDLINININKNN